MKRGLTATEKTIKYLIESLLEYDKDAINTINNHLFWIEHNEERKRQRALIEKIVNAIEEEKHLFKINQINTK